MSILYPGPLAGEATRTGGYALRLDSAPEEHDFLRVEVPFPDAEGLRLIDAGP